MLPKDIKLKPKFYYAHVDSVNVSNIGILDINSREITFNWTWPYNNMACSVSHYELTATNCGRCPNETSGLDTQATCTEISTDGRLCMFSVQAIETFKESQTVSITALLKGKLTLLLLFSMKLFVYQVPDMPEVNVMHCRTANDPQENVHVVINEVVS